MLLPACAASSAPLNNGIDCSVKMGAPVMLILMPAGFKWHASDEVNFLTFLQNQIAAASPNRFYPLFGNVANIRTIADAKESDVTVTYDDGSMGFIRNGMFSRTFTTNKGGLAYAKALMSINSFTNWAFIEIDKNLNVLRKQNSDGSFSGVPLNVAYAATPELATLKTEFLIPFVMNFSPADYISRSVISKSTEYLLDITGLTNCGIINAAAVYTNPTPGTGTITVTAIGANADTINVQIAGTSISGGAVAKTASESTVTLLAAKIVAAINGATATNGGYSATNTAGVITLSINGDAGNGITPTLVLSAGATIAATATAISGGVTTTTALKFDVQTLGTMQSLLGNYASIAVASAFSVVDNLGNSVTPSNVAIAGGLVNFTGTFVSGRTYTISGAGAAALNTLGIVGYEITQSATVVVP